MKNSAIFYVYCGLSLVVFTLMLNIFVLELINPQQGIDPSTISIMGAGIVTYFLHIPDTLLFVGHIRNVILICACLLVSFWFFVGG